MTTKQIVTHKQTVWQTVWSLNNRQSEQQTVWKTDSLNNRQPERQTDTHTQTQTDSQADRHSCWHTNTPSNAPMHTINGNDVINNGITDRTSPIDKSQARFKSWRYVPVDILRPENQKRKKSHMHFEKYISRLLTFNFFLKILYQLPIGLDVGCL